MTLYPPGPPPEPDGLRQAFRTADRRRLRTLLTTTAAPAVALVLVSSLPVLLGGHGAAHLVPTRIVPTPSPTTGPSLAAALDAPALGAGPSTAPSAPVVIRPPSAPAVVATPARSRTPRADLTFSAYGTATTTFALAGAVTVDWTEATYRTAGTEQAVGLYLQSVDGSVSGGLVHFLGLDIDPAQWHPLGTSSDTLPRGKYQVWVVGSGPTTIRLPVVNGTGRSVTATRGARALLQSKLERPTGAGTMTLRLPLTIVGRTVGVAGGWFASGQQAHPLITACVTARDASCASSDPQYTSQDPLEHVAHAEVPLAPGALPPGSARDVLVEINKVPGPSDFVAYGFLLTI